MFIPSDRTLAPSKPLTGCPGEHLFETSRLTIRRFVLADAPAISTSANHKSIGVHPGDDVSYRTWEVGYWFDPSSWGRGFGTEAVTAFTRWMFDTFPKLHTLEAVPFSRNVASGRLLKKVGFVLEGVKRDVAEKNGVLEDESVFSLLRSDLQT